MSVTGFTLGKITIKRFNYWPNQAKDYCYLATIKDVTFFSFSTHSLFFLANPQAHHFHAYSKSPCNTANVVCES